MQGFISEGNLEYQPVHLLMFFGPITDNGSSDICDAVDIDWQHIFTETNLSVSELQKISL